MAGRGPAPKSSALRQRRNKKPGASTLPAEVKAKRPKVPKIPNPDGREWHPLTKAWWKHVWQSPMESKYLTTDVDGLGRLAVLVDQFYNAPDHKIMTEIRLQEARFGLTPVDRLRLQWEIASDRAAPPKDPPKVGKVRKSATDPRGILGVVT